MRNANKKSTLTISDHCYPRRTLKSTTIEHLIKQLTFNRTSAGVLLLTASMPLFTTIKMTATSLDARSARRGTVWTARQNGTTIWTARKTRLTARSLKMIRCFRSLSTVWSTSSALNAGSGLRKMVVATVWPADAGLPFAMAVDRYQANVYAIRINPSQ